MTLDLKPRNLKAVIKAIETRDLMLYVPISYLNVYYWNRLLSKAHIDKVPKA